MDIVGRHQWETELFGKRNERLVGAVLLADPVILDLDEKALGTENLRQRAGVASWPVRHGWRPRRGG